MGGASIVPQRGGRSYRSPLQRSARGWRSPAAAGLTAGPPIVSYGFVGIAFVSVSRLCPYKGLGKAIASYPGPTHFLIACKR